MKCLGVLACTAFIALYLLGFFESSVVASRPRNHPEDGTSAHVRSFEAHKQRKHLSTGSAADRPVEKASSLSVISGDSSSAWIDKKVVTGDPIPQHARNLVEFLAELREIAEVHRIQKRPIEYVFNESSFLLSCDGDWMEFGVADGKTIRLAGEWRLKHCGPEVKVHGFDTFTGLPEPWSLAGGEVTFQSGTFSQNGRLPEVPSNVVLHKGLFIDSLPDYLTAQRTQRRKAGQADHGVTYMHVDCDLYTGAAQALLLNAPRMQPGTILIFDELVNYPNYRDHEVKALWEWLAATGLRLRVIGIWGASDGEAILLDPPPHLSVCLSFLLHGFCPGFKNV
eukprot:jgi/Botrbrau1/20055/Bobra.200_1s0060.1